MHTLFFTVFQAVKSFITFPFLYMTDSFMCFEKTMSTDNLDVIVLWLHQAYHAYLYDYNKITFVWVSTDAQDDVLIRKPHQ